MRQFLLILFAFSSFTVYTQDVVPVSYGKVESVLEIPVFMYNYPVDDFEEVDQVIVSMSGEAFTVRGMVKKMIKKAKVQLEKRTVGDFDAILIDPDSDYGTLIKFNAPSEMIAEIENVGDVPVFLYAQPLVGYEEVTKVTAMTSLLMEVTEEFQYVEEKIIELVAKAQKKERKGKVDYFDAMMINPDSNKGSLIKYQ